MTPAAQRKLIQAARKARRNAYAPYSRYKVGAAALDSAGRAHAGCNVENVSYGLTICAERAALCRAVADGAKKIRAIAIVAGGPKRPSPCGACRQFIAEFGADVQVICAGESGATVQPISELLPAGFDRQHLR